ncbi:hypothetical protein, partial [Prevotella corporis]|uniref:hypothetical protein n=1 Tax=Prevotella corporis TaxID=28128 RepID=UPI0023F01A8B
TNGQLTTFTGGIVTELPMERVQIGTPDGSNLAPGITTRTSMNRDDINGDGAFFWEPGDVIYVEDDGGKLHKSQNIITETKDRVDFSVYGSYTGRNQYDVYYCGDNAGAAEKKVVIADNQTQSDFNNTKHFGAVGDCGVAKAEKNTDPGKSGFKFDLQHKSSYLCFLPYITTQEKRDAYKIKSIEITSNNNICGTYVLTQTGLTGDGNAKTITLHVGTDGLLLADKTVETINIKNSLYVVIAPGDHILSVKYTVYDTNLKKDLILEKKYKSHTFGANMICNIPVNLDATAGNGGHDRTSGTSTLEEGIVPSLYSGRNYYMWDAAENYWSGHEWDASVAWQPIENDKTNDGYPKSKTADASRWYHEGSGSFEASNALFKQLPNANEIGWYVLKGDAHWDNSTQWTVFGKTYTGGLWLKKLSVIAQENGKEPAALKQADPKGNNLLQNSDYYYISPKNGKPADSEIGNYFFLPALGYYYDGKLDNLGFCGYYWSSSACPSNSSGAYSLNFYSGYVDLDSDYRNYGFVAQPFE